jgi:hypothetical protein
VLVERVSSRSMNARVPAESTSSSVFAISRAMEFRNVPSPTLSRVAGDDADGAIVYEFVCAMGAEGIVSKRAGSRYISGRCDAWRKCKNPNAPAIRREAEEDWGRR